jgi:hypothetical protein
VKELWLQSFKNIPEPAGAYIYPAIGSIILIVLQGNVLNLSQFPLNSVMKVPHKHGIAAAFKDIHDPGPFPGIHKLYKIPRGFHQ